MSSEREESCRKLPAGKLNNIRKLFDNGDISGPAGGKDGKPVPPARPVIPPNRNRSPAARPPPPPKAQPRSSTSAEPTGGSLSVLGDRKRSSSGTNGDEESTLQFKVVEARGKVSPTVSRRITSLTGGVAAGNFSNNATTELSRKKSEEDSPPTASSSISIAKRISSLTGSSSVADVSSPNHTNCGKNENQTKSPAVPQSGDNDIGPDFYTKVNKKPPEDGVIMRKPVTATNSSSAGLARREAVRKTNAEQRRTIAVFQSEDEAALEDSGVSVASRMKMFGQQNPGGKPSPPKKTEAVRRQFSLRASKESSPPISNNDMPEEDVYDCPWDGNKNSNVEKLRKLAASSNYPPCRNVLPGSSLEPFSAATPPKPSSEPSALATHPKPALNQKPSLPTNPPPRISHSSKLSDGQVKASLSGFSKRPTTEPPPKPKHPPSSEPPSKPKHPPSSEPPPKPKHPPSSEPPSKPKHPPSTEPPPKPKHPPSSEPPPKPKLAPSTEPPPKPKLAPPPKPPRTHAHDDYFKTKIISSESDSKDEDGSRKKSVQLVELEDTEEKEMTEYPSIKDRISQMQKQQHSSSDSDGKSVEENNSSITYRHRPPTRPPPPKRRPNSSGNPPSPTKLHAEMCADGPLIIPFYPKHLISRQKSVQQPSAEARKPDDELPQTPGKPIGRFPLRKSLSSECVHRSRNSFSLDGEDDVNGGQGPMLQSMYTSEYEAVIDPDGYAVPNEFMRLPVNKKNSDTSAFYGDGECPSRFLTRIEGFGPNTADTLTTPPQGQKGGSRHLFSQDVSPGFGASTMRHDQCLEKVGKKKMLIVKQKINQAYADLDIVFRPVSQVEPEDDVPELKESVVDQSELKKRIEHCSSIRQKTRMSVKKSKEYMTAIYPQLFEYCLVVGLRTLTNSPGYEPYVIHKFPENRNYKLGSSGQIYMATTEVSSNLSVPSFCFPDASIFKPGSMSSLSESYSFVMTYADGSRVYGYCRRLQLLDVSLPEVICIISPIDAFNMYNTLLSEIESRRRISMDLASEVIAASFGRPLPKPGKVCHIRTLDQSGEMETIFLNRPSDNRLGDVNYESPLCSLGTDKLVKVFSSMLMERRIILCSSHLSVLTETVHALCALLYPFQWQHVYIPLLPSEMLDVVCAPMPYIVGILSAYLPQVFQMELEEVFVVDLDKKSIIRSIGDESTLIPRKIQRALKTAINMCKIDNEARNAQWLMVAEAFLRMFIELIGHFGSHVCTQQDGNRIFQKEGFIIEMISKEIRQFLEWFTETQMFEVFIVNHVEKSDWGSCDLFMQRLQDHKECCEETRRHNKGIGAKVKNFRKAIKTKLAVA